MQVLPSMLEVPTGSWFDYTDLMFGAGGTDWNKPPVVKPGDASFWTGPVRSWDARCARCHTTDWKPRRPDAHGKGPRGTSLALGVGCEACHGPGSRHVDFREAKKAGDDPILHYAQLARSRAMGMCLQCHMEGEVVDPHFRVGDDVFEARDPILLVSPELIDPSGRPLELIYDGVPFATSRCAQKGKLTCISCHDPHGTRFAAQLRQAPSDDRMCTRCHVTLGKDPKAHTHHDPGGPGGRCVNCHMPFLTIERGHGVIADHSISTPRYDLHADRAATPACTWCHAGKRDAPSGAPTLPEAALRKAHARWYGTRAAAKPWMQALGAARLGEPDAWKALVRTLGDHDLPRVVRASAAELLGRYAASAPLALLAATHDEDSLVRRRAVAALADLHGEAVDRRLREALEDPSRAVRMAAARAALEGWKRVQADRALLKAILPVLRADAEAVPEDDMRWFRLGAARGLAGDEAGALEAYERELELDPFAGHVRQTVARLKKKLGR
jgi:predicted CXXCH cytochrome family protein